MSHSRASLIPFSLIGLELEQERAASAPIPDDAPSQLHQRLPVFLGSRKEIAAAVRHGHPHDTALAPAPAAAAMA